MKSSAERDSAERKTLNRMGERLFTHWAGSGDAYLPNAPNLLLYNPQAPHPDIRELSASTALALRLAGGSAVADLEWGNFVVARSETRSLPFQTASLGAVVLCHLVSRGDEEELAEACRLLQPGGRLFIVGLNRLGLRNLAGRSLRSLPAISPLAVRARLETLEMSVLGLYAAGFLRRDWPRMINRGAARIFTPLADVFLIVAKPLEPRIMNPLAKQKLRAVGAPSAVVIR